MITNSVCSVIAVKSFFLYILSVKPLLFSLKTLLLFIINFEDVNMKL